MITHVPTNVDSDLDDVSEKDETRGEFPSSESTAIHIPGLVIKVDTLYDGGLGFSR